MNRALRLLSLALFLIAGAELFSQAAPVVLRYSHPNAPTSIAGMQADYFAKKVAEYTKGAVKVEVFPSSQLGTLQDQAQQVSAGVVAIHHNTAAGIGSLYEDFGVLDTPFIYKDVDHLMRVVNPASALMKKLSDGLSKKSGVHVLYTFYFGARELTCDRPIKKPADLKGLKIRSVPFPIYAAAVEGMGAIPTPIDWSQTPGALATKVVNGQENPVNTILAAKLYDSQAYIMMTNHILGAQVVVINDSVWASLSKAVQDQVAKAAADTASYATKMTVDQEAADLKALTDKGMKAITAADGLDLGAFKAATKKLVDERFGAKWGSYYTLISGL